MRRHGCHGISVVVGLSEKRSISRPLRDRFLSSKTLTLGRVGTLSCCFAGMHDPARSPWFFRSDDRDRRLRDGCDTIAMQVRLQRCFFTVPRSMPGRCLLRIEHLANFPSKNSHKGKHCYYALSVNYTEGVAPVDQIQGRPSTGDLHNMCQLQRWVSESDTEGLVPNRTDTIQLLLRSGLVHDDAQSPSIYKVQHM